MFCNYCIFYMSFICVQYLGSSLALDETCYCIIVERTNIHVEKDTINSICNVKKRSFISYSSRFQFQSITCFPFSWMPPPFIYFPFARLSFPIHTQSPFLSCVSFSTTVQPASYSKLGRYLLNMILILGIDTKEKTKQR
ncbi:hypothetical protein BU24DRAFT_124873 [Aaosphaeria arxii CBS 175.79]|uniref:Secreted protein n=1 Tax=Aaosphaeria arxii CBS 175.79 TaxID=1450172 RepID=A0A6A5Y466_9PLEO|nr:uncharacterized protein BU24DRAFT_124873 [Aaosphaeria arxii CBS 175.79]KAF2019671.1 hypothetical protein BU24DRAFT_124873 [Aaosphaeria arxii CBS 175.79]